MTMTEVLTEREQQSLERKHPSKHVDVESTSSGGAWSQTATRVGGADLHGFDLPAFSFGEVHDARGLVHSPQLVTLPPRRPRAEHL